MTRRPAFTLVELLVAMSIFVVLAALTVGGWRSTYDADRVGEAASILRGGIEGARSRAIKAKESRGLRLLLDPNDGRIVTGMVYIGMPDTISGYLRYEYDNTTSTEAYSQGQWRVFDDSESVDADNYINWRQLAYRGLLRSQCQITFDGETFTLDKKSQYGSLNNGEDDAWILSSTDQTYFDGLSTPSPASPPENSLGGRRPNNLEPREISTTNPSSYGIPTAVASRRVAYTLVLAPGVLDGAAPVNLPVNTCVDLDGSKIPENWRPAYNNSPRYGPPQVTPPNGEVFPIDIMFNSNGRVSNSLVSEGFLHFRMASIPDIVEAKANLPLYLPNTTTGPIVVKDPLHQAKLVTLVTQTGMLRISNVNGEGETADPPVYNNDLFTSADRPFLRAILGREAKQ